MYERAGGIYNNTKDIHDDTRNILGDTKDIHNDTKNILVRQLTAVTWPMLITWPIDRKVQFWKSWSLCEMQGTRLVIMIHASLGLESLFSRTSCSGPRPLRTGMCSG